MNRCKSRSLTLEETVAHDEACERRESLVRRIGKIMDWPYHQSLILTGFREVAKGNAVIISNDKLEELCKRMMKEIP